MPQLSPHLLPTQSTAPGLTTLYFASGSIPADVIPGTSVADTTSPDTTVIPAGTQCSVDDREHGDTLDARRRSRHGQHR